MPNALPIECDYDHADGCLSETTWDDEDCTCRCPVCGLALRDGYCRWAPHTRVTPPGMSE